MTVAYIMTKIHNKLTLQNQYKGDFIMARYGCVVCGWIYDEEEGYEEMGIAPGTPFEELPEDFTCPLCGVEKDQFDLVD